MIAALETEQQLFVQQRAMHELFSSLAIILERASDAVKQGTPGNVALNRFFFLRGQRRLSCVVLVGDTPVGQQYYICLSEDRETPEFSY